MARIQQVYVEPRPIERFSTFLGEESLARVVKQAHDISKRLAGRAVWNINSTASGGGVAEMLASLLAYPRAAGIDTRWAVIEGTPDFFLITKRVHQALHGSTGDGSPLGEDQHAVYKRVLDENATELVRMINPGDIVILHDPQTAGLAPDLLAHGCPLVWRCHIGDEATTPESEYGWAFLSRYLSDVPVTIFSRHAYVPPALDHTRAIVVPPSIDPFSPKCESLDATTVRSILEYTGLIDGEAGERPFEFTATDGSSRRIDRRAQFASDGSRPRLEDPLVLQVSRWDPLKDPSGVIDAFTRMPREGTAASAHLMIAGPDVTGVADDPEATATLEATLHHWEALPADFRARVHLVSLPTADVTQNASMVNALQSHASVVVQKSLREGFGLTVTEAMWKARPVVASRIGGIQDQIEDGVDGIMLDDPRDVDTAGRVIGRLLNDTALAGRLGSAARTKVLHEFLPPRHLSQYGELLEHCLGVDK